MGDAPGLRAVGFLINSAMAEKLIDHQQKFRL